MKKGGKAEAGHKKMAMGGGAMDMMMGTPALVGRPAVNAPVRAPGKPSMASRRKAMMAKKPAAPMAPPMKKGGESKKTHMAEMSKMKGLEKELKSHESKPASKGHKGLKTGGVALGNAGGFKKGGDVKMAKGGVAGNGIINTEKQGGKYRDTLMHTAEYTGKSSGKTGDVKMGNGGGYKTGGVALGNAGGYKNGGRMKKMAMGGSLLDQIGYGGGGGGGGGGGDASSGLANVNQGASTIGNALKNISGAVGGGGGGGGGGGFGSGRGPGGLPVSPHIQPVNQKRGGKVSKKAYAAGGTVNSGRPVAMPQGAKKPSTPVSINQLSGTFKKGGKVTPAEGRLQKNFAAENKTAMKQAKAQSNEVYSKYGKMKMAGGGATSDKEMDMSKGAYDRHYANERAENEAMRNMVLGAPKKLMDSVKGMFSPKADISKPESVTKTKESVTVTPAGKRRGGRAC
jgi:hypothetical protein